MFYNGSREGGRVLDPAPMTAEEIRHANVRHLESAKYFHQLFDLRRRNPGDDLTSQLVQAEEDGSKLSNEELTANIMLLFGAGHETTVNLIGNGLLALHRHPDQLALLKAKPELIANAIEEFLRYESSVQLTPRAALQDIDDLAGIKIPKGEIVVCLLGSANRPSIPTNPTSSILRARISSRCPLVAESISVWELNWPEFKLKLRSKRFCAGYQICGSTTRRIRNGGRPSTSVG